MTRFPWEKGRQGRNADIEKGRQGHKADIEKGRHDFKIYIKRLTGLKADLL